MAEGFDNSFGSHMRGLEFVNLYTETGRVKKVLGPIVEGILPGAIVGGVCDIIIDHECRIEAEIVGFRDRIALLMPLASTDGIKMGARIEQRGQGVKVAIGDWMQGKLINGLGKPFPGYGEVPPHDVGELRDLRAPALSPVERSAICEKMSVGVRAIDTLIPLGIGQRLAVMAASGVGKSMLMGMMAKHSQADVNVIALIGERGREVLEFMERDLGPEGLARSVVVAVTSDESPVLKVRGAYLATAIAEHFRDQGKNCLLMMDSVTRFGMALREIGLAAGEPPTTKGYTPSVFAQLPKLLERAGAKKNSGSITGLYSVLVEGNDFDDPIADSVRSILDGHVILSRDLASKGHYPAIDVLESVSRLSTVITSADEQALAQKIRRNLSIYKEAEDLINIGGYRQGNNPDWDMAIKFNPGINAFLRQGKDELLTEAEAYERLGGVGSGEV